MNEKVNISIDAGKWMGKLEHTWNYIGYDECNYTHSPGGMELIAKFGKLEKPYYMRAHHMLCTGIMHGFYKWGSTNVYTEDEEGKPVYYFDLIDHMVEIWLNNNCKPFFELGFMPRDLADPREAENKTRYNMGEYRRCGWAMPPKDYQKWYDLIYNLVAHLKDRFGEEELSTWYFEMWNEPDIFYWRGTHEEFCKMYDYAEAAIHAVSPALRFGGPASCGDSNPEGRASNFLRNFLKHVKEGQNHYSGQTGTRLDFVTFHTKGGIYSGLDAKPVKQIPSVKRLLDSVVCQTNIIREMGYDHLEIILSEADPDAWAAGGRFDNFNLNFRNTEYYPSFVMAAYKYLYDYAEEQHMDIRPLAWAFMFEGERCFEGTRAFSTQGIDKAVFNLFKFFAKMGTQKVELLSDRSVTPLRFADINGTAEGPQIDGWATQDGDDAMQILLFCHHDDWDVKGAFDVHLKISNLPMNGSVRIKHYRIDAEHSNPYGEWLRQGSPNYPNEGQRAAILARSGLEFCEAPQVAQVCGGQLERLFALPVHGISLLVIEKC